MSAHTHMVSIYYRPRFMGGDVLQPLCCTPETGWMPTTFTMSAKPWRVDCAKCLRRMPKLARAA